VLRDLQFVQHSLVLSANLRDQAISQFTFMEGVFFTHLTLNYELPDIHREFITVPYTSVRLFNLNPEIKRLNMKYKVMFGGNAG